MTKEEHAAQLKKQYYKENPNTEKSIKWFINAELNKTAKKKDYKLDARYADYKIKHCTKCNLCWQEPAGNNSKTEYYENFPSYGKEKVICKRCKG